MKNFHTPILIFSILSVVAIVAVLGYFRQVQAPSSPINSIDYTQQYPETAANSMGFEKKKSGSHYTAYFHAGDEARGNQVLAVLEQAGVGLYEEVLSIQPQGIPVYVTTSADEYVKISDFPGGKEHVDVHGIGSVPNADTIIYLYIPQNIDRRLGSLIIHEGTHSVMAQKLGRDGMRRLPGFINEGLAHYVEYSFLAGSNFDPARLGDPGLFGFLRSQQHLPFMHIHELAPTCEGYLADKNLDTLCRAQGVFTVWYINTTYGKKVWSAFLTNLKQMVNWQQALEAATGKTIRQLDTEILGKLQH